MELGVLSEACPHCGKEMRETGAPIWEVWCETPECVERSLRAAWGKRHASKVKPEPPECVSHDSAEFRAGLLHAIDTLSGAVQEFDATMAAIGGCTDGDCLVTGPSSGIHTNGGCKCWRNPFVGQRAMRAARKLRAALAKKRFV
jgi:hypothetical protein